MKSMTGFGTAQFKLGAKKVIIEAKSVNHKFCEINVRLPARFGVLESKVFELAKSFFTRGRIDIFFKDEINGAKNHPVHLDVRQIKQYLTQLKNLKTQLKLPGEIDLDVLLRLPNVIVAEEEANVEAHWDIIKKALLKSFKELEKMRLHEGQNLSKAYGNYLNQIEASISEIETYIPENLEQYEKKLEERLAKLNPSEIALDPSRLAQEIAFYVDRSDVAEELVRLKSHIHHFRGILKEAAPIGRKLDFLLQEINREVNTLGSKSASAKISQETIVLKQTIEKMREQIQNVE